MGGLVGQKNGQHKRQQVPSGENREEDVKKKAVYVGHSFGTTENNEKAYTLAKNALLSEASKVVSLPGNDVSQTSHCF